MEKESSIENQQVIDDNEKKEDERSIEKSHENYQKLNWFQKVARKTQKFLTATYYGSIAAPTRENKMFFNELTNKTNENKSVREIDNLVQAKYEKDKPKNIDELNKKCDEIENSTYESLLNQKPADSKLELHSIKLPDQKLQEIREKEIEIIKDTHKEILKKHQSPFFDEFIKELNLIPTPAKDPTFANFFKELTGFTPEEYRGMPTPGPIKSQKEKSPREKEKIQEIREKIGRI